MEQDPTDPTGVRDDTPRGNSEVRRARDRKANSALQLRIAGAEWDEIAQVLGFPSGHHAQVATERALESELHTEESKKHLRQIASKRLDRLVRSVWSKAINPDNPEHLQYVDRARQLIDRHAKLHGLDAPTEMVVNSPTAEQLEQWVASVVAGTTPALPEADIFEDDIIEGEVLDDSLHSVNGD